MKFLLSFGLLLFHILPLQSQNLMAVKVKKKWGVVNADKEMVIEPQFEFIGKFDEQGRAIAQKKFLYGIIDSMGNTIIDFKYKYLKPFSKSNAWAFRENDFLGVINSKDSIIIQNEYESIEEISDSRYTFSVFVLQKNGKASIANWRGKTLCKNEYDSFSIIDNNFIESKKNRKIGLIHKENGLACEAQFESIKILNRNFMTFRVGNQTGVYSLKAKKIIISNKEFAGFKIFQQDGLPQSYLYVYQKDKVGIINEEGELILKLGNYEQIKYNTLSDVFLVRNGLKFGISSNKTGKLITPKYDLISSFRRNIAQVIVDDKKGVINTMGEEIVQPIYKRIEVKGNSARLYLDDGSMEVLMLDDNGRIINRGKHSGKIRHLKIKKEDTFDFSWTKKEQQEAIIANQQNQRANPNYIWLRNNSNRWGLRRFSDQSQTVIPHIYNNIITANTSSITIAQQRSKSFLVDDVKGEFLVDEGVSWDLTEVVQDFETGSYVARWKYAEEDTVYNAYIFRGLSRYDQGKNQSYPFKYYKGGGSMEIIKVEPFINGFSKFQAQNNSYKINPKPTHWGIMNDKGYMILNAIYDDIEILEDDSSTYFVVTQNGIDKKYGFVDSNGKVQIDLKYNEVRPFSEGKAAVLAPRTNWGIIDTTGKFIIAPKFTTIGNCKQGKIYSKTFYGEGIYFRPDSSIAFKKKVYKSEDFDKNNFAIVQKDRKYGMIDTSGNWILKIKYWKIDKFNKFGLAKVRKDRKYYFVINTTGQKTHQGLFVKIEEFNSQGLARVRLKNKLYNFINSEGKVIAKQSFKSTRYFNDGLVAVQMPKTSLWGFIDATGRFIIRPKYKTITSFCNGYAKVSFSKDTLRKRKNARGKEVYEKVQKTLAYYIDLQENQLSNLPQSSYWFRTDRFIEIGKFQNDLAKVKRYGRYGFINKKGEFKISFLYQEASDFYQGYSFVKKRDSYFYIDTQGNITENVPKSIQNVLDTRPITERYEMVEVEGKKGLIDLNGRFIVPPKYNEIGKFSEGLISVGLTSFKGVYDVSGNLLLATEYEDISLSDTQTFRVEVNDKVGYWHTNRGWIWDLK